MNPEQARNSKVVFINILDKDDKNIHEMVWAYAS